MPAPDLLKEGERQMMICNACRYCEGYCAVFPAMELRRSFTKADLTYLANLCFENWIPACAGKTVVKLA
jgi:citrate/tricarballylate utilization protein